MIFRYLLFLILCCPIPNIAYAFGTHSFILGQDSEHEKITRAALLCKPGFVLPHCFDENSLSLLAGKVGYFGAVGMADDPETLLFLNSEAHCDNGDYNIVSPTEGYDQTKAQANLILTECRDWIKSNFELALEAAGELTNETGDQIIRSQSLFSFHRSCIFIGNIGYSAKCRTYSYLGLALHATQDFYSHSNWTDAAYINRETYDVLDPPGLNRKGPSPWLDLPGRNAPVPSGLITGCFKGLSGGCPGRTGHDELNKDHGNFTNNIPGLGTTQRGALHNNFSNAASAAMLDTSKKLIEFKSSLEAMYGIPRANLIMCALLKDKPQKSC